MDNNERATRIIQETLGDLNVKRDFVRRVLDQVRHQENEAAAKAIEAADFAVLVADAEETIGIDKMPRGLAERFTKYIQVILARVIRERVKSAQVIEEQQRKGTTS